MDTEHTPNRPHVLPTPTEHVWSEFLAVLDSLPPSARVVFLMHDVFGATFEEISGLVGLPAQDCRRQVDLAHRCAHEHARSVAAVRSP